MTTSRVTHEDAQDNAVYGDLTLSTYIVGVRQLYRVRCIVTCIFLAAQKMLAGVFWSKLDLQWIIKKLILNKLSKSMSKGLGHGLVQVLLFMLAIFRMLSFIRQLLK